MRLGMPPIGGIEAGEVVIGEELLPCDCSDKPPLLVGASCCPGLGSRGACSAGLLGDYP
jgi:hypothetical protein